jgi:hypothetical protein
MPQDDFGVSTPRPHEQSRRAAAGRRQGGAYNRGLRCPERPRSGALPTAPMPPRPQGPNIVAPAALADRGHVACPFRPGARGTRAGCSHFNRGSARQQQKPKPSPAPTFDTLKARVATKVPKLARAVAYRKAPAPQTGSCQARQSRGGGSGFARISRAR